MTRIDIGYPYHYVTYFDDPNYDCEADFEFEEIPRDEFGVPAHIPPEVCESPRLTTALFVSPFSATQIRHTYYVPPQYFPFLKKLGDDTPELKPYTDKVTRLVLLPICTPYDVAVLYQLIMGDMTYDDYEEMFYKFAKPLKIYRHRIPLPYRTVDEIKQEDYVRPFFDLSLFGVVRLHGVASGIHSDRECRATTILVITSAIGSSESSSGVISVTWLLSNTDSETPGYLVLNMRILYICQSNVSVSHQQSV